jgi:hypothetical protein
MIDDDDRGVLGLKRGESIPMTRHGEEGVLYRPRVQLNMHELGLYAQVWVAWGDRDMGSRENVVALIRQVAQTSKFVTPETFESACEHVVQYVDELACLP